MIYEIEPLRQRNMSLKEYRKKKTKMLERDFCIRLTQEDIDHMNELKNEIQIDQFCISLIMNS